MDTAITIGRTNKHWSASIKFGKSKPTSKVEATAVVPSPTPKQKDSLEAWVTAGGLVMVVLALIGGAYWILGTWSEKRQNKS